VRFLVYDLSQPPEKYAAAMQRPAPNDYGVEFEEAQLVQSFNVTALEAQLRKWAHLVETPKDAGGW
jgi:hypothetical protein